MTDLNDVIEAFVDGELVEPDVLRQALSEASCRDHLIDALVLRGLVGGEAGGRPALVPASVPRADRVRWLSIAAAIAVVGLLGGYALGARSAERSAAGAMSPAVAGATELQAPAPTQVIHLRNGVDWQEQGGH